MGIYKDRDLEKPGKVSYEKPVSMPMPVEMFTPKSPVKYGGLRGELISSHKYDTLADAYRHGVWAGKHGLNADDHPYPDKPYLRNEYCRGYAAGMLGSRDKDDRDIELRAGALKHCHHVKEKRVAGKKVWKPKRHQRKK